VIFCTKNRLSYQGATAKVAIARALASEANIILADEPTGALDQKKGNELMKILAV